jgi:hypothetical protein
MTPPLSPPSNLLEKALPKKEPPKEWLMEVKHSSEAIRIRSPSTTIPCSIKGTVVEALHDPTVEASIMSEFIVETLLGDMPLAPTNKLFTSPSGLIFECRGIATALPIIIDKTKVGLDIHIYPIIDFDLLLGFPLEELLDTSQGILDEKLREALPHHYLLLGKSYCEASS